MTAPSSRPGSEPDGDADPDQPAFPEFPPGAESYPLEVSADDGDLGTDPETEAEPCPSCGAPRRMTGSGCLRCGWGTPPAVADVEASDAVAAGADDGQGAGGSDGVRTSAAADIPGETWDDQPLARPWPLDARVTAGLAAAAIVVTLLAGLIGTSAFPPGLVRGAAEEGGVGFLLRIAWITRLVLVTAAWWAALVASFVVLAWTEDRPFGGRAALLARAALIAAVARLVILLPIQEPAVAFLVEGLLFLAVIGAGVGSALRVPARVALGITGAGLILVSGIGAAGRVVGWAILG